MKDAVSVEEEPSVSLVRSSLFLRLLQELPPETLSERVRRVQQQWSLFRAGRFASPDSLNSGRCCGRCRMLPRHP